MRNYPDCRHFPKGEYDERTKRLQAAIAAKGADALIVHTMANICWLCGLECVMPGKYFMMVVPISGEPRLLVQSFEVHNARINTYLSEEHITQYVLTEDYAQDYVEASAQLIKKMGLSNAKLLFEMHSQSASVGTFIRMKEHLPEAVFEDAQMCVEYTRSIKTKAEILCIRKAAKIASHGIMDAVDAAGEGVCDNEIAAAAYRSMVGAGSEYMCLPPIVTVGKRSGIPHTTDDGTAAQKGDSVLLEFGACYKRYTGVTMRTVSIGEPTQIVKTLFDAAKRSVENTISKIRPGARGSDIADSSAKLIQSEAQKYLWHGCYGYSVGLGFPSNWEDAPIVIRQKSRLVLEPGMVFHTSTTFRDIAVHGVTVSETVLVTKSGCEVLTSAPRELFIK